MIIFHWKPNISLAVVVAPALGCAGSEQVKVCVCGGGGGGDRNATKQIVKTELRTQKDSVFLW